MPEVSQGRLVGRELELGRLLTLLGEAAAGRPVVALVSGGTTNRNRLISPCLLGSVSHVGARVYAWLASCWPEPAERVAGAAGLHRLNYRL